MKRIFDKLFGNNILTAEISITQVREALERVRLVLPSSPCTPSLPFSELLGRDVLFKWDNKFKTGSFKERGAVNMLLSLTKEERAQGVCAASAGNHALALSYHAQLLGIPCLIVMPKHAPLVKVQSTKNRGAEVILEGETFQDAYALAQDIAKERSRIFVPPYDHPLIIAGQGTAGLELLDQGVDFDSVIVPCGGGGLLSGIALAIKAQRPDCFILGVQSEWAAEHRSPHFVKPVMVLADTSIADGIAVKTIGKVTGPIIDRLVDKVVTVSENSIARAIISFLENERVVVEGAGAAGLAALVEGHLPDNYKKPVIMVCGSNIDVNLLSRLIEWDMGERDRLVRINASVPDRPGSLSAIAGLIAQLGGNILEVNHDRSFSHLPGNVDITFLIEVRNLDHKHEILNTMRSRGITATELAQT
jgi:threonine dehydratase